MIKAIIFDCFGVVRSDALDEAYRAYGGDPDQDRQFLKQTIDDANSGKIHSSLPVFAEHFGITPEEWGAAITSRSRNDMELLAYTRELGKQYKIVMLSNISKGGFSRHFEIGFLEQYFDDLVASTDIGYAKPDVQAYVITAERQGVRPEECVMIDDRQEYIDGAKAAGMRTILYTGFEDFKKQLAGVLA